MNGYIQVDIGGTQCGLKFNMYALEQMESVKGNSSIVRDFTGIVYAGMLGNAYAKQVDPPFTFEEISDWVDENSIDTEKYSLLKSIADAFYESSAYKSTMKALDAAESKKKEGLILAGQQETELALTESTLSPGEKSV